MAEWKAARAVGKGETVKSRDTFAIRYSYELPGTVKPVVYWNVTTTP